VVRNCKMLKYSGEMSPRKVVEVETIGMLGGQEK